MIIPPRPTLLTFEPNPDIVPTWYPVRHLITETTDLTIQRGRWITGDNTSGYIFHAYTAPEDAVDHDRLLATVNQRDPKYKCIPCKLAKGKGKLLIRLEEAIEQAFTVLQANWNREMSAEEENRLIIAPLYARAVMDHAAVLQCRPANREDRKRGKEVWAILPRALEVLLKNFKNKWYWENQADMTDGPPKKPDLDVNRPRYDATDPMMDAYRSKKRSKRALTPPPVASGSGSFAQPIVVGSSPAASPVKKRLKNAPAKEESVALEYAKDETLQTYEFHGKKNKASGTSQVAALPLALCHMVLIHL